MDWENAHLISAGQHNIEEHIHISMSKARYELVIPVFD
jgi:hypothetical protein